MVGTIYYTKQNLIKWLEMQIFTWQMEKYKLEEINFTEDNRRKKAEAAKST